MGLFDIFRFKQKESKIPVKEEIIKKEVVKEKYEREVIDQSTLIMIAKTNPDYEKRMSVVIQISDQAVLSFIALNDSSNHVCGAAVKQLTDQNLLTEIARTSQEPYVRQEAIKKITDQAVLSEIIKTEDDWQLRGIAIRNITDQNILAEIAKKDENETVRELAFKKISDEAILTRIKPFFSSYEVYIEKDQSLIAEIAKIAKDVKIRETAISKLQDPNIIIDIARNDCDPSVRKAALKKITDTTILSEIEKKDNDEYVRRVATRNLQWPKQKNALFDQLQSGQMADTVRTIVETYVGSIDDNELLEWVKSTCDPMDRKATYALAKEFRFHWTPGESIADEIHTLFTSIENVASKKELVHEEGAIKEGYIVWERFPDNDITDAKSELHSIAQSERIKKDIVISGFAGWVIYVNRETAEEIKILLLKAGSKDSVVEHVRVYMSGTDPRIPKNSRGMENGCVLEYLDSK